MPIRLSCSSLTSETVRGVSSSGLLKPNEDALGAFATAFSGFSVTLISLSCVTSSAGFQRVYASSANAVVAARAPRIADTARATSGEPQLRCELYIRLSLPKTVRKVGRVRASAPYLLRT